jgi:hypothetical protein
MELQNPQGMLSTFEAVDWVAKRKYPDSPAYRREHEEAWRDLCNRVLTGLLIAYVLTEDSKSYKAGCAQFAALQEEYIFHTETLRYPPGEHEEMTGIPRQNLRDEYGKSVWGRICFLEPDLEAAYKAKASPDEILVDPLGNKPLPEKRHKSQPLRDCVRPILKELYPKGIPSQSREPNQILLKKVNTKLKEAKLDDVPVSNDTIMRAANRRRGQRAQPRDRTQVPLRHGPKSAPSRVQMGSCARLGKRDGT